MLLAGGLTPTTSAQAIRRVKPVGRRRVDRGRESRRAARTRAKVQAFISNGPGRRHRRAPGPRRPARTTGPTSSARPTGRPSGGCHVNPIGWAPVVPPSWARPGWARTQRTVHVSLMAEPTARGPLRRVRRPVRPRDAGPRLRGARGRVPRRVGRPRVPGRAAPTCCATTPAGPSPVTECHNLGAQLGIRLLLKREDLNHTGSHKINNVLGQALLAKRMGKTAPRRRDRRRPARRRLGHRGGAVGHGVQGLHGCGRRRAPGAQRVPHEAARRRGRGRALGQPHAEGRGQRGHARLGGHRRVDATTASARSMGPHPYPWMVREFHRVIGDEARAQCRALLGARPRRRGRLRGRRLQRHRHLHRLRRHRRRAGRASSPPAAPPWAAACPAWCTACRAT